MYTTPAPSRVFSGVPGFEDIDPVGPGPGRGACDRGGGGDTHPVISDHSCSDGRAGTEAVEVNAPSAPVMLLRFGTSRARPSIVPGCGFVRDLVRFANGRSALRHSGSFHRSQLSRALCPRALQGVFGFQGMSRARRIRSDSGSTAALCIVLDSHDMRTSFSVDWARRGRPR